MSLFVSEAAMAQVPPICTSLSKVTCAGGPRTDVTGKSEAVDARKFADQELTRIRPIISKTFKSFIATDKGEILKEKILDALPNQKSNCIAMYGSDECNEFAAAALAELYIKSEGSLDLVPNFKGAFDALKASEILAMPAYRQIAERTTAEQSAKLSPELRKKFLSEIYPNAKKHFIETVNNLSIDEKSKAEIIKKVKTIKPATLTCDPIFKTNTGLLQSFFPNAQYDENEKEIGICPAYLLFSTSEFDLTALIAHEIAHSVDPCNLPWGMYDQERKLPSEMLEDKEIENQYLKENFLSCLRSDSSVGALSFRPDLDQLKREEEESPEGEAKGAYANSTHRTCGTDQINESVSDWFAAETVARFIEARKFSKAEAATGVSNIYRSMCVGESSELGVHPPMSKRLDSIFAAHPKIRVQMGCSPEHPKKKYCDINNPASLTRTNSPSVLVPKTKAAPKGAIR